MARYLIAAALVAAVTAQATVGHGPAMKAAIRAATSASSRTRIHCAHAHVAKLPSWMQIRPDTKPAGWWQQSGWAPPSACTPLVANLVSTGCSPDSALPSTSGADSEELPTLQGTQLNAKRATLAVPPSSPPSRSPSGCEVVCLNWPDPLPRSPPAYVDALGNLRVTLTNPFIGAPSIGASATNGGRTRARRARSDVHITFHFIRLLALRSKGARARDSTVYGGSSTSAKSIFVHHTQLLAAAAQVGDAKGIRKKTTGMKMRLIKDALKATGRG